MTFLRQHEGGRGFWRKLQGRLQPVAHGLGYESRGEAVWRMPPVDFRGLDMHPREAVERACGVRFVIDIPLEKCRGHRAAGFVCTPGTGHPYIETAREILEDRAIDFADTTLRRYYSAFQPRSAAESLGIEATHPMLSAGPGAAFLPWNPVPDTRTYQQRKRALERENLSHGVVLGVDHGFHHFGPVSKAKGELEVARLSQTLKNIETHGFRFFPGRDGISRAQILCHGDDFVALISKGQHRTAAVAALGHEAASLWPLPDVVCRNEVSDWPGVRMGIFTSAQALKVFDRIFAGRQVAALTASYKPAPRRGFAPRINAV